MWTHSTSFPPAQGALNCSCLTASWSGLVQRCLESGGRLYGMCCSSVTIRIFAAGSFSLMALAAANEAVPPPTRMYGTRSGGAGSEVM